MAQSETNPDEMSPDAFCEMMIEHKIGSYGRDFLSSQYIEGVLLAKSKNIKENKKANQHLTP